MTDVNVRMSIDMHPAATATDPLVLGDVESAPMTKYDPARLGRLDSSLCIVKTIQTGRQE